MRNLNPLILGLVLVTVVMAGMSNIDGLTLTGLGLDSSTVLSVEDGAGSEVFSVNSSGDVSSSGAMSSTGRATIGTLYPGGGCPSLASAATIAPTESCHTLTGSTPITNITTGNFTTGDRLLLIWGGSITLTHGNDISIGLDFAGASGDVAELVYGGANFSKITTADNTP